MQSGLDEVRNDKINDACERIYDAIQICQKHINMKQNIFVVAFIGKYAAGKLDTELKACKTYLSQRDKMGDVKLKSPLVGSLFVDYAVNFPHNLVPVVVRIALPIEFQNDLGPEFGKGHSHVINVNLFKDK